MTTPLISVLVLTYHPQENALFSTLRSIVKQKDCNYEVIIADDGSPDFFEEKICAFLDAHHCIYKILAHKENQGTVQNILDGVRHASGAYVKPISPGDYLYDDTTLRDTVIFMKQHRAKAAFGKMVFYACQPEFQVKNLTHPILPGIYEAENYRFKKASKQQLIYGDFICGASAVYETAAFQKALETISPAVRYAEDSVFQLFALERTRIYALPRYIVWYEHGSGISTKKTDLTFTRIDWDFYHFYQLTAKLFPKNSYVQQACRLWELRKAGAKKRLLLGKLRPDRLLFSLRAKLQRNKLQITDYNDEFFRQCHIDGM